MQKPLILNEILYRKHFQEQNKYLKMKLCNAKPIVNHLSLLNKKDF